jgi:3-oxoacyl-[acyl-carrier protein] reductase
MTEAKLAGHVALVTGGSRGIGRATSLRLARAGAAVAVNYNSSADAAQDVVDQITSGGGRAVAVQGDVSDKAAVEAMLRSSSEQLGTVDILVNNAGILMRGELLEYDEDELDAMWRINVKGVIFCAAAAAAGMIERGWGRIINLSSNAGIGTAFTGTTMYAATKGAVLILTKRMAFELGQHGITVNAVLPGFTRTDMTLAGRKENEVQAAVDLVNSRSVLGYGAGEPQDIACAIEFLSSEESRFITGQLLMADGGRMDYLSHV